MKSELLFVRAKNTQGFRRAGAFFPSQGKTIDPADFTKSQLQQIKAEPRLMVTEGAQTSVDDTPHELLEDIVEAIGMLDPDKKPNVKDLENIIGKDMTASQRDTAWAVYQARVSH